MDEFLQLFVAKAPKMAIHLNSDSHSEQNNSNITPESNKSDNLPSRFIELPVMEVKLGGGGSKKCLAVTERLASRKVIFIIKVKLLTTLIRSSPSVLHYYYYFIIIIIIIIIICCYFGLYL
jgi:hypothetical protein